MRLGAVLGESRLAVLGTAIGGVAVVAVAVAVVALRQPQEASTDAAGPDASARATVAADVAEHTAASRAAAPAAPEAAEPREQASMAGGAAADPPAPATPDPPRFDQVRVAPDGSAVIAGRAPPGAAVSLRLDGAEIGTASGAAGGAFAAILSLSPADTPRILSLLARMPDGTEIAGAESVIISPFGMRAPPTSAAETDAAAPADGTEVARLAPQAAARQPAATADDGTADAGTAPEPPLSEPVDMAAPPPASPAAPAAPRGDAWTSAPPALTSEGSAPDPEGPAPLAARPEGSALPTTEPTAPRAPQAARPDPLAPAPDLAAPRTPGGGAPAPVTDAPVSPALVVAGPEGLRVIRDEPLGPPDAQTEIRIDAISYTAEGAVTLSGIGAPARQVQVFIDNAPIRSGEIGPGGQWSLELPDVDPGTYTLSVAQIAPGGDVEGRVETPFLREDPARIAASPMLVGPGVSVITVQPGFTLWGIADANFGDGIAYVQIFERNRDQIRDPDLIFPGQIFRLPDLPRGENAAP